MREGLPSCMLDPGLLELLCEKALYLKLYLKNIKFKLAFDPFIGDLEFLLELYPFYISSFF